MALTQPSWNGQEAESQERQIVKGRRESENRQNSLATAHPWTDFFKIFSGLASPEVTISIVADGKNIMLSGNRKTVTKILAEAAAALHAMEPGK